MSDQISSRILIVDDDYFLSTDVLGYQLKRLDFIVVNAYTALEFEERWREADVIVLDIRLPQRPGEPIDPWGGLLSLNKIRGNLGDCSRYPQLENCIIRSAQTEDDAKAANIPVPVHFRWFSPDVSFSELLDTVREVAAKNSGDGNRDR
jgi:CheY-like chemotaxis protein